MSASSFQRTLIVACHTAVCLFAAGCQRVDAPVIGRYRAVLQTPGGELPFGLDIASENERPVMYLLNGNERTRIEKISIVDGTLTAAFSESSNSLQAKLLRNGLRGTAILIDRGSKPHELKLSATLGETHRFFAQSPTDNADVEGRWEIEFTNAAGARLQGVALFEQKHARVIGSIQTATGTQAFLEGELQGDELRLSQFAGDAAHLYTLEVNDAGELEGEYFAGFDSSAKVVAKRNADAEIADVSVEN